MSLRIKKDLRNLFPEWVLALLLVSAPVPMLRALGWEAGELLSFHLLFFALATAWLGAAVFGKDVSLGMLAFSLANSESRKRLWTEKLKTLVLQIGSVFLLAVLPIVVLGGDDASGPLGWGTAMLLFAVGAIGVANIGGGTFFSLALRSYQGAFWFTLLTPFAMAVVLVFLVLFAPLTQIPVGYWVFVLVVTLVYGLVLVRLAESRLLGWQDLGPWGGEVWISLRSAKGSRVGGQAQRRRYRPWLGLVSKEVSLQQLNLFTVVALLVLYVAAASVYNPLTQTPDEAALLVGLARLFLLFFLPLAIGATAIAEERRLQVSQWQQVLPVSGNVQWLLKAGTVYGLTLFCTGIVPVLLDAMYRDFWSRLAVEGSLQVAVAFLVPLLAATVGLYASSLSNSFLVALGTGLAVILGCLLNYLVGIRVVLASVTMDEMARPELLFAAVLTGVGVVVLGGLSVWNFRSIRTSGRNFVSNGLIWGGYLVGCVGLTIFVYGRGWESMTYRSPAPGPKVSDPEVRATIVPGTWSTVLAPDGTLWTSDFEPSWSEQAKRATEPMIRIGPAKKWVRAFSVVRSVYLIDREGRLFRAAKWGADALEPKALPDPRSESRWVAIASGRSEAPVYGLKADGSLWTWTEDQERKVTEPIAFQPETRWRSIAHNGSTCVGVQLDHSLWAWGMPAAGDWTYMPGPDIRQIAEVMAVLFPREELPTPSSDRIVEVRRQYQEVLDELGIDLAAPGVAVATSREASNFHTHQILALANKPRRVGSVAEWEHVRYSERILGHVDTYSNSDRQLESDAGAGQRQRRRVIAERILIATRVDGSVWVPKRCAHDHWGVDPEENSGLFAQIPSDREPLQLVFPKTPDATAHLMIDASHQLLRVEPGETTLVRSLDLTQGLVPVSDRKNWLRVLGDHYSLVALSDDGKLWHSGPYPFRGSLSNFKALLIPASPNLRPVFDFQTGQGL